VHVTLGGELTNKIVSEYFVTFTPNVLDDCYRGLVQCVGLCVI